VLPPYNIYSALRSAMTPNSPIITDINSKLAQSKIENKKLRALGKVFYPTDKDKLKKPLELCVNSYKLDDLDPDN
jgi:hypothetical protein